MTSRPTDDPEARRRLAIAAIGLVFIFACGRTALLVTSFDSNSNWEEPVFAFSAGELAREGLANLFDHQDDLRHGGGLVIVMLGIPWFAVTGGELMGFKAMAIFWSTLTLLAYIAIGWRYFSPWVGIVWGVLFCASSGASARLNVTLVGSHPEALLPIAVAIACYLELTLFAQTPPWRRVLLAGFGVASLGAIWFAYISVVFVVPLCLCWLSSRPRVMELAWFGLGGLVGIGPWLYQNMVLRPHGAALPQLSGGGWFWSGLVASFGNGDTTDAAAGFQAAWILTLAALLFVYLVIEAIRGGGSELRRLAPFLLAPPLGAVVFVLAEPTFDPAGGYYNFRYFVPLQASLYWVIAIGLDRAWPRSLRWALPGFAVIVLAHGLWIQSDLLGRGSWTDRDWEMTRPRGCYVFGTAEADRSPDRETAIRQIVSMTDEPCRGRALNGLGVEFFFAKTPHSEMLDLRSSLPENWPPVCTGFNQNAENSSRLDCRPPEGVE